MKPSAVPATPEASLTRRLLFGALGGVAAAGWPTLSGVATAQEGPVVVDLETDRDRRMTTPVYLNDAGPFNFVVDTGANRSVIATEVADRLGLERGPMARIHAMAGAYAAPTARSVSLRVGAVRDTVKTAPLLSSAELGADGLIGVDLLRNRQVTMDFTNGQMTINRASSDLPIGFGISGASDIRVPARQRFGQLMIIDAEINRVRMSCFIDTGAERSVGNMALHRAVAAKSQTNFQTIEVQIRDAAGQVVPGQAALLPHIRLGGVSINRFVPVFADLHVFEVWDLIEEPALLVGMDMMRLFEKAVVDFGRKEVRFSLSSRPKRL